MIKLSKQQLVVTFIIFLKHLSCQLNKGHFNVRFFIGLLEINYQVGGLSGVKSFSFEEKWLICLPELLKSTNFAVGTIPGFPMYPGGSGGTGPGGI